MKISIALSLFVLATGVMWPHAVNAQVAPAASAACPKLSASSPAEIAAGAPLTMSVIVSGGDRNVTPTFNWTVSAGTISRGQGTPSISIDSIGTGNQSITGTVEIGGLDGACDSAVSTTTLITGPVQTRLIDQIGAMMNKEDQYLRLDNFAIELQNDPGSTAAFVFYAGRKSRKGAIEALTDQTQKYLTENRGIDASRLKSMNGGFREEGAIEMWIVPTGGQQPMLSPTVDPSEARQLPPLKKPFRPVKKTVKKKTRTVMT